MPTKPEDGDYCTEAQEGDARPEGGRQAHALHGQVEGAFDALAEAEDLIALASERLHHAHPGDGFFQNSGGVGQLVLNRGGQGSQAAAEEDADEGDQRDQGEHEQGQAPIGDDDQDQGAEEGQHLGKGGGDVAGDHPPHGGDVVGQTADQLARAPLVEEAERESLQMLEQAQAQVGHDALTYEGQQIAAHKGEGALRGEDGDQDQGDAVEQLGVVPLEDGVDQKLQGVRPCQAQHTSHHDGTQRQEQPATIRTHEGQQPSKLVHARQGIGSRCRLRVHRM